MICGDLSGCGTGWSGEAWDYQSSTQIVQPIATNNITDMFPPMTFNLDALMRHAENRFGVPILRSKEYVERFGLVSF